MPFLPTKMLSRLRTQLALGPSHRGELLAEPWDSSLGGQRPSEVGIKYIHKEPFKGSWKNWGAEKIGGCSIAHEKKIIYSMTLQGGHREGRASSCDTVGNKNSRPQGGRGVWTEGGTLKKMKMWEVTDWGRGSEVGVRGRILGLLLTYVEW